MNVTALNVDPESGSSSINCVNTKSAYDEHYSQISKAQNNNKMFEHKLIKEKFESNAVEDNEEELEEEEELEDDFEDTDVTLDEKMLNDVENLLYNNTDLKHPIRTVTNTSNSHSLPQLPVYSYNRSFKHSAHLQAADEAQEESDSLIKVTQTPNSASDKSNCLTNSLKKKDSKESKCNYYLREWEKQGINVIILT